MIDSYVMALKKTMPPRGIIHTRDIQNLTGLRPRTARELLSKVRKQFGKARRDLVSVKEFCLFTGISESLVHEYLTK